jgi:hypothetical protein
VHPNLNSDVWQMQCTSALRTGLQQELVYSSNHIIQLVEVNNAHHHAPVVQGPEWFLNKVSLAGVAVAVGELAASVLVGDDNNRGEERAVGSHDHNVREGQASFRCLCGRDGEVAVVAGLADRGQSSAAINTAQGIRYGVMEHHCLLH